jgi:hypothetical protein
MKKLKPGVSVSDTRSALARASKRKFNLPTSESLIQAATGEPYEEEVPPQEWTTLAFNGENYELRIAQFINAVVEETGGFGKNQFRPSNTITIKTALLDRVRAKISAETFSYEVKDGL